MKQWGSVLENMSLNIARSRGESLQEIVDRMKRHPVMIQFMSRHADIDMDTVNRSITAVYQAIKEYDNCERCPGLERCPNLVQGYQATLTYNGYSVENGLYKCNHLKQREEQLERERLISSQFVPSEIMEATFKTIERERRTHGCHIGNDGLLQQL